MVRIIFYPSQIHVPVYIWKQANDIRVCCMEKMLHSPMLNRKSLNKGTWLSSFCFLRWLPAHLSPLHRDRIERGGAGKLASCHMFPGCEVKGARQLLITPGRHSQTSLCLPLSCKQQSLVDLLLYSVKSYIVNTQNHHSCIRLCRGLKCRKDVDRYRGGPLHTFSVGGALMMMEHAINVSQRELCDGLGGSGLVSHWCSPWRT